MKNLFYSLLFLLLPAGVQANSLSQLEKVNAYWAQQNIDPASLPEIAPQSDRAWIRTHLLLVEKILRSRNVDQLSVIQQFKRMQSLDDLHEYMVMGQFPVNDAYAYATPIFIDPYDNFCAVGYLIKASGQETLSRKIAQETNLAYVKDMDYPELLAWADDHGFSVDELAWIQPQYGPADYFDEVSGGVAGEVRALFPVMSDFNPQMSDRLYVGGDFVAAGGDSSIRGIGYLSPTDIAGIYEWNRMGDGLPGTVHKIIEWNGNIIAAGALEVTPEDEGHSIMQWNGSEWEALGCLNGLVKSLAVVAGELYASGMFTLCGEAGPVNFAHWQNGTWEAIPGLDGHVNVLRIYRDTSLVVGGLFSYDGVALNLIKWSPNLGFTPYENGSKYEVNDVYAKLSQVYAACSRPSVTDSIEYMVLKLDGDLWTSFVMTSIGMDPASVAKDYYVIEEAHNAVVFAAGGLNDMNYNTGMVPEIEIPFNWFADFDGPAYDVAVFQHRTFMGGAFTQSATNGQVFRALGMYHRVTSTTDIDKAYTIEVYPNPVHEGQLFVRHMNAALQGAVLVDLQGRTLATWSLSEAEQQHQLALPRLASGVYFLKLRNQKGQVKTEKLVMP